MQKTQKLLLLGLIISVTMIGSGYAFAQTNNGTDSYSNGASAGIDAGIALKISGFSVLPGLLMSLWSVYNKNITGTGTGPNGREIVNPRKLAINILLGVVVGVGLNLLGMDTNTIKANSPFLTTIAVLAVNYMFLHWTNLGIRPLFAHLVTFLGAVQKAIENMQKTSPDKSGAGTASATQQEVK